MSASGHGGGAVGCEGREEERGDGADEGAVDVAVQREFCHVEGPADEEDPQSEEGRVVGEDDVGEEEL